MPPSEHTAGSWMFQQWEPTEQDDKTWALAKRYHEETEAYDRTVCTGPIRGGSIFPRTAWEMAQINANARQALHRILDEARREGIEPIAMRKAICKAA